MAEHVCLNKQKVIGVQVLENENWGGERMAFLKRGR